jgi:hypothetical protein
MATRECGRIPTRTSSGVGAAVVASDRPQLNDLLQRFRNAYSLIGDASRQSLTCTHGVQLCRTGDSLAVRARSDSSKQHNTRGSEEPTPHSCRDAEERSRAQEEAHPFDRCGVALFALDRLIVCKHCSHRCS